MVIAASALFQVSLGQHSIWTHYVADSSNPRWARDTSGNLYLATRTATLAGRELTLQKFNALGAKVWEWTVVGSSGGLDRQYNIRSVSVGTDRVMVVVQERAGEGAGAHHSSIAMSFLQTTGSFETLFASTDEFIAGAAGGGYFGVLRRNASSGVASVDIRSGATFGPVSNPSLGATEHAGAIAMDASGNAYAGWTNTSGVAQLSKFNALGTELYSTSTDLSNRNEDRVESIVVDTAVDRVYLLASGRWSAAPFDLDVLLRVRSASAGADAGSVSVGVSTDDDIAGDLVLARPSGVLASAHRPATSEAVVRRVSSSGFLTWSRLSASPGSGSLSLAQDADNNALLFKTASSNELVLDRYSEASGSVMNSYSIVANSASSRGLYTDSAGSFYLLYHNLGGVLMRRMQPAIVGGPTVARTGGTTESGYVSVQPIAVANQVWTLTSSNSSVVSVPGSVTVLAGEGVGYFEITLNPVTSTTTATINARFDGFITQRQVTVIPPVLSSILVAPNTVIGGLPTTAQVILNGKAPTGGRLVTLSSNKPTVASVPANVTVLAGSTTAFPTVTTYGVATNQGVVITATLGAVSKTAFMAVNAPSLTSAGVSPGTVQGGNSTTLTLGLNGIAPTGGLSIVLLSGAPGIVLVPGTGAVPAGATTGNITINTAPVTTSTNVLIFATRAGIYRTATLTVTP